MKIITKEFCKMKQHYKQMQEVLPKELGIRNKINIHYGIDASNEKVAILSIVQKSRVLLKDVAKFEAIIHKLSLHVEYKFNKKVIMLSAPICSKALKALQEKHFSVITDATV